MKFKILIFTFNIVLLACLFIVFFLPLFYVDASFVNFFWKQNIIFIPIFIAIGAFVNFLLFRNKSIVEAIESEDWTALSMHLEEEIFEKDHLSFKNARLYLDACFLLSDFNNALRLEKLLFKKKTQYVLRLSHTFAATKLLSQDFIELAAFCQRVKNIGGKDVWIDFYTGIAELKLSHGKEAKKYMFDVVSQKPTLFLQALAAHVGLGLVKESPSTGEAEKAVFEGVYDTIKKQYSKQKWNSVIEKETQEMRALVFIKLAQMCTEEIYTKTG